MVIVLFCSILIYLLYGNVSVPGCFCTVCGVWYWHRHNMIWVFFLGVQVCVSCAPAWGLRGVPGRAVPPCTGTSGCHPLSLSGLTAPRLSGVFSCISCINKKNSCFPCEPAQSTTIPHTFVAHETLTAKEGTEHWGWGCASPTTSPIPGRWHRDGPRVGCKQGEAWVEGYSMSCIVFKALMIHRQRKFSSLYINLFY